MQDKWDNIELQLYRYLVTVKIPKFYEIKYINRIDLYTNILHVKLMH